MANQSPYNLLFFSVDKDNNNWLAIMKKDIKAQSRNNGLMEDDEEGIIIFNINFSIERVEELKALKTTLSVCVHLCWVNENVLSTK